MATNPGSAATQVSRSRTLPPRRGALGAALAVLLPRVLVVVA